MIAKDRYDPHIFLYFLKEIPCLYNENLNFRIFKTPSCHNLRVHVNILVRLEQNCLLIYQKFPQVDLNVLCTSHETLAMFLSNWLKQKTPLQRELTEPRRHLQVGEAPNGTASGKAGKERVPASQSHRGHQHLGYRYSPVKGPTAELSNECRASSFHWLPLVCIMPFWRHTAFFHWARKRHETMNQNGLGRPCFSSNLITPLEHLESTRPSQTQESS